MQKAIHPEYRPVVFKDASCDYSFLTRSTIKTGDTIVWEDGNQYPLVMIDISSASHPFFTGKQMLMDTAGRIDRFKKKYTGRGPLSKEEKKEVERKKEEDRQAAVTKRMERAKGRQTTLTPPQAPAKEQA